MSLFDFSDPRIALFQGCFEHARVPTTVCTRKGVIVYQNRAALQLSRSICGPGSHRASLFDMFLEDDRPALIAALGELGHARANTRHQARLATDARTRMSIDAYLHGDHEHVVLTTQPSEKSSGEQRFRTIAQASHDAIWEWNCVTGELHWHAGLQDIFGYDDDALNPSLDAWAAKVHPDDHQRVVESLLRSVEEGQSAWVEEYRFRRADGSWATVVDRGFATAFEGDRPTRLIGGITDVTADRQANATIRQQAALIEQTHDAIWVRDLDGTLRFWNPGAERIFGWSNAEVVGRAFADHDGEDTDALPSVDLIKRRGSWNGIVHRRDRQGSEVILEERWTLLRDEHDTPNAILIVGTDITERHHLQTQFLRIQRVESMGSLAAGIAHDLNNLLAPIHFGVDYLRSEQGRKDPHADEVLNEVASSVRSASSMVHQILNYARGKGSSREVLDLPGVANEALRIVTRGHAERITTELDERSMRWSALGDPTQIQQLLLNLCVNARDAIDGSGRIAIAISESTVTSESAARNPDAHQGNYVRIDVRDTGRGMSDDVIVRVFEPFYTTKDMHRGTGIGLSTSISIVRSHGGFIEVDSAPGQGTLFSVFLPAHSPHEEAAEPITVPDDPASGTFHTN